MDTALLVERRTHPRVSLSGPVRYYSKQSLFFYEGEIVDISLGGMRLKTLNPSKPDNRIMVNFRLPSSDRTFNLDSAVVWYRSSGENDALQEKGVRFLHLPEEEKRGLGKYIASMQSKEASPSTEKSGTTVPEGTATYYSVPLQGQVRCNTFQGQVIGEIMSINFFGMLIEVDSPLKADEKALLSFRIMEQTFRVKAHVIWSRPLNGLRSSRLVEFRFVDPDKHMNETLNQYIDLMRNGVVKAGNS